jgi:hypothetical protein
MVAPFCVMVEKLAKLGLCDLLLEGSVDALHGTTWYDLIKG